MEKQVSNFWYGQGDQVGRQIDPVYDLDDALAFIMAQPAFWNRA